jgi:FkbM family methyltransferase
MSLREPSAQLRATLEHQRVDAVIDVGANRGQYALRLREAGWRGPILSFEPIIELRDELAARSAADPLWEVAPAMALAAADGEGMLEVSAESDMSSLLPQSDRLRAISPSSAVLRRVRVPIARLDGLASLHSRPWRRLFVKIDVQGGEPAVLAGMSGLWDRVAGLQLELALLPLYEGERPWLEVVGDLARRGFAPYLLVPGYFAKALGRQVQVDMVFYRDDVATPESGRTG